MRKSLLCIALLFVAVVVIYGPALSGLPIWDDSLIFSYPWIRADGALANVWLGTGTVDYWPLTYTSLWIEWRLFGTWYSGYHAVNLGLHLLVSVLVWRLLLQLRAPGALPVACLFALHPVNTEAVAWMFQLKTLQAAVGFLGAWLAFMHFEPGRKRSAYVLSLVLCAAALLSKTSAATLPVVLTGWLWWKNGRLTQRDARALAPFFFVAVALAGVALWFQQHRVIGTDVIRSDGLPARLATAGQAVWFYLGKALFPWPLSFVYPRWQVDASQLATYVPLVLLAGVGAALAWRPKTRPAFFALGYFVVTLAPSLGLIDVYFMRYAFVADHWQYLSLPAVLAGVVGYGSRLPRPARYRTAGLTVAFAVLAALTWSRAHHFRSAEAVWQDTIVKQPSAWLAYDNLAMIRLAAGQLAEAIDLERQAVSLEPRSPEALCNLGAALVERGELTEGIAKLEQSLAIKGDRPRTVAALAVAYARAGRLDDAIRAGDAAAKMAPGEADYHLNLGLFLADAGRFQEALQALMEARRLRPEHGDAAKYACRVLIALGRASEALAQCTEAANLSPKTAK